MTEWHVSVADLATGDGHLRRTMMRIDVDNFIADLRQAKWTFKAIGEALSGMSRSRVRARYLRWIRVRDARCFAEMANYHAAQAGL